MLVCLSQNLPSYTVVLHSTYREDRNLVWVECHSGTEVRRQSVSPQELHSRSGLGKNITRVVVHQANISLEGHSTTSQSLYRYDTPHKVLCLCEYTFLHWGRGINAMVSIVSISSSKAKILSTTVQSRVRLPTSPKQCTTPFAEGKAWWGVLQNRSG